jgi:hypothetical protein
MCRGIETPRQLPFSPAVQVPTWIVGALGAAIAVIEGLQQLNQYHANWISYRSTCEVLKHEKYLYLGKAGPYIVAADARALLAERVESLVSQEHAKCASSQVAGRSPRKNVTTKRQKVNAGH